MYIFLQQLKMFVISYLLYIAVVYTIIYVANTVASRDS